MEETDQPFDLEERLLEYAAAIVDLTEGLGTSYAKRHIAHQLLRSGTAPLSHHGEGQAAESPKDFIHKFSLALKELRESQRWLKLLNRTRLIENSDQLPKLLDETDQLIRIFATSIRTASKRLDTPTS